MHNVTAHAVRNGNTIEVTVGGDLPNSCYTARIKDFYPGGSIVYIKDPGSAQVFIEETTKPGSMLCTMRLVLWMETISIPDKDHDKVEIFINNHEVLEVPVVDKNAEFIVIAVTGTTNRCSIIPKNAPFPGVYSIVFGPASHQDCDAWVTRNCE